MNPKPSVLANSSQNAWEARLIRRGCFVNRNLALGAGNWPGAGFTSVGYVRPLVWLIGRERINGDASCDDGYQ